MRVLVADDDRDVAALFALLVRRCEHEVVATITGGGLEVIRGYSKWRPDLVLMDIMMPKFNGFTVCHELRSRDPLLKVILVSGVVGADYPSFSQCGPIEYLSKPLSLGRLREAFARLAGPIQEPGYQEPG